MSIYLASKSYVHCIYVGVFTIISKKYFFSCILQFFYTQNSQTEKQLYKSKLSFMIDDSQKNFVESKTINVRSSKNGIVKHFDLADINLFKLQKIMTEKIIINHNYWK